jgi:tetratricopeptide (TPR) repeat protein
MIGFHFTAMSVTAALIVLVPGGLQKGRPVETRRKPVPDINSLWDFNKPAETEAKFRLLLPEAEANGNEAYRLEVLTQIARAQGLQDRFADAHKTLDEVEKELAPHIDRVRVRYLLERGRTFNSSDHPKEAKPPFLEAWDLARKAHEEYLAVDAAHMVAIVESPKEAEKWNLKALAYAETCKDPKARNWRASLYNNLGWTYHDSGRFDEALAIFQEAVKAREEMGDPETLRIARWAVGRCLRSLGRIDEALAIQQDQMKELERSGRTGPYVYEEMGECLYALGRKPGSRPWFARAYAALSKDDWLVKHEPARIARLKQLADTAESPD